MDMDIYIVCINYGYDGWRVETFATEEGATQQIEEAYGSPVRIFKGKELILSLKEKK